MRILTCPGRSVILQAFSPDGRFLAAVGDGDRKGHEAVRVWDLSTGADAPAWSRDGDPIVRWAAFEPDGRHLLTDGWTDSWIGVGRVAVGTWGRSEHLFMTTFGPQMFAADGRVAAGDAVADGCRVVRLARCGPGGWVKAWEVPAWHPPARPTDPVDKTPLGGVLIDPPGERVVRVEHLRTHDPTVDEIFVRSFAAADGAVLGRWVGPYPSGNQTLALGPGGRFVVARGEAIYAADLNQPDIRPVRRTAGRSRRKITAVAFSPDGRWLATTSNDALVTVWEAATWSVARQFAWDIGRLRSVAFSPDGTLAAAGSDTGRVVVWDFDL